MPQRDFSIWEERFRNHLLNIQGAVEDPAHDIAHLGRVVAQAKALAISEKAKLEVVIPAAWFHDLVNVPKNDPRRSMASRLSAEEAKGVLQKMDYPSEYFDEIGHAIEAHSYSAGIDPKTLEAQIVQDSDRLDGLGAIGVARVFAVAGLLGRRFYDVESPFGQGRAWNDMVNTVDHFYVKLFKTVETLKTQAGREEGRRRADFMRTYLSELAREIGVSQPQ